jgi:hypothetical protein
MIKINCKLIIVPLLLLVGCQAPSTQSSFGNNIVIAEKDTTHPLINLVVSEPGGHDASVSTEGSDAKLEIIANGGPLRLRVIATDSESGIQALQIWVSRKITLCDSNGVCSMAGPLGASKPSFETNLPKKMPGEETAESETLTASIDLLKETNEYKHPEGGVGWIEFTIYAVAVNHLGGRIQSPTITAVYDKL